MPCNPAVGGTAKGHLVREIDALGGLMGLAIDATGIQFKVLNKSRGPAVWSPRAQADKGRYSAWVKATLEAQPRIHWIFGRAGRILVGPAGHHRPGSGGRSALHLPLTCRHDRHIPERLDPCRARAAPGRTGGGTAVM